MSNVKINKVNFDGAYLRSSSGHFFERMMVWFKNIRAVFQCFLCLRLLFCAGWFCARCLFPNPVEGVAMRCLKNTINFWLASKKGKTDIGCSTREVLMYDFIEMVGVSSHLNVNIHKKWKQSRFFLLAPTGALVFAPLPLFHITSSRSSKFHYNLLTLLKNLEHLCLYT